MHSKLQHISIKDYYQFITFRTYDSVDEYVTKIQNSNDSQKLKQYKIDQYLDKSTNGAYLSGDIIDIFMDIILQEDENLYDMEILSIMPNHIHMLFKQRGEILGKWVF